MPKIISLEEFNKIEIKPNFEKAESCNFNHCVTPETKLIIVGTITPPAGAGYFYSAPRNKIYGYLDECFSDTNLKELKKQLHSENSNKTEIVEQIKQQLISKKIAFLDVIKYAIRKKDSPADNDITFCTLDEDVFKITPNATIVCNSRLAEECFCSICDKLHLDPSKHIFLSQRSGLKKDWISTIKSVVSLEFDWFYKFKYL